MRLRRLAITAALVAACLTESAPARADWISLGGPYKAGEVDGWTWLIVSMLSLGAMVPQGFAGGELRGSLVLNRKEGVGIFAGGVAASALDLVILGFARSDAEASAGALLGGPVFSMMGVGLGRTISLAPRSAWLGGSMGFTTFALTHGIMATAGVTDSPGANGIQALHAALGGIGCFVDVGFSRGAERWTGVGCGVASAALFVHGVVKSARGDNRYRVVKPKRRAVLPSPWITREVTGVALSGAF